MSVKVPLLDRIIQRVRKYAVRKGPYLVNIMFYSQTSKFTLKVLTKKYQHHIRDIIIESNHSLFFLRARFALADV